MEDEDGEVVKKYDIPPQQEGKDYVATGLKYMGIGSLVKPTQKALDSEEKATDESQPGPSRPRAPTFSGWAGFGKGASAEQKKSDAVATKVAAEEDDRQIRFTIGGVGRRMTKDDFLKEMQKLDPKTRREVVELSNASAAVKTEAKQPPQGSTLNPQASSRDAPPFLPPQFTIEPASGSSSSGKSPERPADHDELEARGRTLAAHTTIAGGASSSSADAPETDAERRRRLAAFASVRDDAEGETPAERRRREAALGTRGAGGENGDDEEEDSDDDNTERIPPTASSSRRPGIRFAEDATAKRRA